MASIPGDLIFHDVHVERGAAVLDSRVLLGVKIPATIIGLANQVGGFPEVGRNRLRPPHPEREHLCYFIGSNLLL